jgi:hypothetical protein
VITQCIVPIWFNLCHMIERSTRNYLCTFLLQVIQNLPSKVPNNRQLIADCWLIFRDQRGFYIWRCDYFCTVICTLPTDTCSCQRINLFFLELLESWHVSLHAIWWFPRFKKVEYIQCLKSMDYRGLIDFSCSSGNFCCFTLQW